MRSLIVLSSIAFVVMQGFIDVSVANCPAISPLANFTAEKFTGRWYEVLRYKTSFSTLTGGCATWNFTVSNANNMGIAFNSDKIAKLETAAVIIANGELNWKFTFGPRMTKLLLVFN